MDPTALHASPSAASLCHPHPFCVSMPDGEATSRCSAQIRPSTRPLSCTALANLQSAAVTDSFLHAAHCAFMKTTPKPCPSCLKYGHLHPAGYLTGCFLRAAVECWGASEVSAGQIGGHHCRYHTIRVLRKHTKNQRRSQHLRGNVCPARALRAPGTLLLDYVPPEEPPSTPLGNALRIR